MRRIAIPLVAGLLTAAVLGSVPAAASVGTTGTAASKAAVIAEQRVGDRLVDLTIASPALGGDAKVRLLTPDGWDRRDRHDRWPVLYLLHGMFGSHEDWVTQTDVAQLRALRNVLVVMPDGGDPGGYYTNWWNGGRFGAPAWETFHLDEVRSILERGYGAGTRRAVAGASMGGYGALLYAGHRPGMFRAVASYSGPVHLLHPESVARWQFAFADPNGAPYLDLWGDPVAQRANWERHDPYQLAGALRHTPVFLSCGDGELGPLDGPDTGEVDQDIERFDRVLNVSLEAELRRRGVPVVTHYYRGTHQPAYWERELHRSLPMLLSALR
ncbi:alpha/beta hydrolase family protein [Micromonospora sp. WMMD1102]|uniref:alpha/beta hydrolase n=1 Tax=Micromonospora sp. WMMD1102 TaxID=3016105 RepID=UPI002415361D|nr:alpha/beta hydrolase family protein [Micromonospora sp. WMMD1102]MDG4790862.1 alpha/beta hydrolase family protein [Micromonospora sp. WMMD1102]